MEKDNSDKLEEINEVSTNYKILNIEIISSCFEPKGLILKINPYGYENSLRKKNDGFTFFGYEEQLENVNILFLIGLNYFLYFSLL